MKCEWCEKDIPEGVAYVNAPVYYIKIGWIDVFYHLSCLPAIWASVDNALTMQRIYKRTFNTED